MRNHVLASPHAAAPAVVAAALGSDSERGLDGAEALTRLERCGPNRLPARVRPRYAALAARQIVDPLVALLTAAATVSALIGEGLEAAVIGAIVIANAALGFAMEAGAERAVIALRRGVARTASVVRSGRETHIPVERLVPGDLLALREGDLVGADARIVASSGLEAVEAALTGESLPSPKQAAAVAETTPLAERASMTYAGTAVTRGSARALVVATGAASELGRIAGLTATARPPATPLERRLGRLGRSLAAAGIAVTLIVAAGMLGRDASASDAFLVGVSVAVAAVPEGLLATLTVALALGVRAMASRGAIVRQLAAVESLGSATVIAADKTGTLTENRLRLAAIALPGRARVPVSGGQLDAATRAVLAAAVIATEAELVDTDDGPRVAGDPVDGAFLLAARAHGLDRERALGSWRVARTVPFDPARKRMTVLLERNGRRRVIVKGAPEIVLARCSHLAVDGATEPLDADRRSALAADVEAWANEGARIMAVAHRDVPAGEPWPPSGADDGSSDAIEHDLSLLALAGLDDPLRPEARRSVAAAHAAGIRVLMLTGDHPATARTIGRELGFEDSPAVTGPELTALDPDALAQVVRDRSVFARVTPADKLAIVESLQAAGEVVAVTGDGVNDAPALRRADVGVAMGRAGTSAAREAADVVLADDNFATIVAAISEGRRIATNVRLFVAFLLSANLGEVTLFTVAVLAGLGAPMTVVQILAVNLLTDGLPAVALAWDTDDGSSMRSRPRGAGALLSRTQWLGLLAIGATVGVCGLSAYLLGRTDGDEVGRTMSFVTIAVAELVLVYALRRAARTGRRPRNRYLDAAVVASAVIVGAIVGAPILHATFGTVSLTAGQIFVSVALALVPATLLEVAAAVTRGGWRRD